MPEPVTNRQDIIDRLEAVMPKMATLGVDRLGIFGSFEKGTQNSSSDVDLLVDFRPGMKTFDSFMELAFLLEDVLQRKVELVTRDSLSPYIGPTILQEVSYVPVAA